MNSLSTTENTEATEGMILGAPAASRLGSSGAAAILAVRCIERKTPGGTPGLLGSSCPCSS